VGEMELTYGITPLLPGRWQRPGGKGAIWHISSVSASEPPLAEPEPRWMESSSSIALVGHITMPLNPSTSLTPPAVSSIVSGAIQVVEESMCRGGLLSGMNLGREGKAVNED